MRRRISLPAKRCQKSAKGAASFLVLLLALALVVRAQTAVDSMEAATRIHIGPGDLLELTVFDEPELSQTVRVSDTGKVDLILLGSLDLSGMSTTEACEVIERLLRVRHYLRQPRVSIGVKHYETQGISVLGEVRKPGVYEFLGSRNLLDIISEAGGVTPYASHEATVKHRSGAQEKVTTTISNKADELLASQIALQPGDTVIIPRAGIVYVLGDVGRPGGFIMQNSGNISLMQAVALASGVNRTGSETKTRVIRKTATGFDERVVNLKRVFEGKDPDVPLEPEDIVYIPPSAIKTLIDRSPSLAQAAASAAVYQGIQAIP